MHTVASVLPRPAKKKCFEGCSGLLGYARQHRRTLEAGGAQYRFWQRIAEVTNACALQACGRTERLRQTGERLRERRTVFGNECAEEGGADFAVGYGLVYTRRVVTDTRNAGYGGESRTERRQHAKNGRTSASAGRCCLGAATPWVTVAAPRRPACLAS